MNWLDILIIALMAFLLVRGLFRGFFREVGSLAGVVLGLLAAFRYEANLTGLLKGFLPDWPFLSLLSFALIMLVIMVACNVLSLALKTAFKKVFLGWLDRTLGVAVAFVKGMVVLYLGMVIINFFVPAASPVVAQSKLYPWVVRSSQFVAGQIPPETYEQWKRKFRGERWTGGESGKPDRSESN
ncbi:CvpA family protein [Desulfatiglans anilini]|uniref:CvpA family protein n=1 Tax=Desulfatiglans anilini TaxID=90728 RepID=UPI000427E204|nr:CvpA family protein [Desulfatiglans anilini]